MLKTALAVAILAGTIVTAAWRTDRAASPESTPSVPADAKAFGVPVGGPNFAQVPPPGFPASFNVTYAGPDGAFATVCYYTGQSGEIMRWTSVVVGTTQMSGPVEITFHTGTKKWRADVGDVTTGNNAAPVGARMQRFSPAGVVPLGYLTIN